MPVEQTATGNRNNGNVIHSAQLSRDAHASNDRQDEPSETDTILGVEEVFVADDEAASPKTKRDARRETHDEDSANLIDSNLDDGDLSMNFDGGSSWYTNVTVEPMIFLLNVAMSLGNPVQTDMYLAHTCRSVLGLNASTCAALEGRGDEALEGRVQPYASVYIMWARLIETSVPAVLTLFVGPWSDTHGRKLFLLLPIVGFFFKYVACMALSLYPALPPGYLLISSVPASLGGGLVSFVSLYYCYVTDVTTERRRGFRMGMVEACNYCGMLVGNAATAHLFAAGGYAAVFGASAALCCVAFVYCGCCLGESVQNADSSRRLSGLLDCGLVKDVLRTACKRRDHGRRTIIFLIVLALSTSVLAMEGENVVTFLFARKKFDWDVGRFTTYGCFVVLLQMIGTVAGVSVLSAWLGVPDTPLCATSYALKVASSALLAASPAPWYLYLGAAVGAGGAVAGPLCPAILSKTVDPGDVGKVFSLLTAAEAVAPLAAAPLYTLVYNATLGGFPGAVFLLSAGLCLLDMLLLVSVSVIQRLHPVPISTRIES